MTTFQLAAFAFLAVAMLATITFGTRQGVSRRVTFAWSLLWVTAAIAIARPELTMLVANALGIARGADLVFYTAILAMLGGFFAVYVRMRRLESEITRLVRELAIRAPRPSETKMPDAR